jgi:hypothetical protein
MRAEKTGDEGTAWRRMQEWALAFFGLVGGRMKRTDFFDPCGAEAPREEVVRRIPAGAEDEGIGVAGQPARRQADNVAQMEAHSSGEGSSREGRLTTTLRSRGKVFTPSARAAGVGGHAVALDPCPALVVAEESAPPRNAGVKFGGRLGGGGGRWRGGAGARLGGSGLPEKRGGGARSRCASASQELPTVISVLRRVDSGVEKQIRCSISNLDS